MTKINFDVKKAALCIVLAVIAFFSATAGKNWAKDPVTHAEAIEYLDEKQSTVLTLSATSLSASTALTLIPGDAATPIANELAELSVYFIITICRILLEKSLLTITGYLSFGILIPLGIGALIIFILSDRRTWLNLSAKIIGLALAIFMLVPVSVQISQTIENSYTKSARQTIEEVNQTIEEIESSSEAEKFSISNLLAGIKTGASETVANIENMLNDFIEQIAIMLVTSCLIPVFVLLFIFWIIKMIMDSVMISTANMSIPKLPPKSDT